MFDFTRTHGRDGRGKFFTGFEGCVQADAFSGYDAIYAGNRVLGSCLLGSRAPLLASSIE
ncbi:MAG: hypothetical protein AAFN77_17995 [Planctomycetota bacterium]